MSRFIQEFNILVVEILLGRYSSGQRGQTVNLLTTSSQVRILLSPQKNHLRIFQSCESSSVGRASAFQAECRRFEPGLSLSFYCRRSSGVERFLGKEEVGSSNLLAGSTYKALRKVKPFFYVLERTYSELIHLFFKSSIFFQVSWWHIIYI